MADAIASGPMAIALASHAELPVGADGSPVPAKNGSPPPPLAHPPFVSVNPWTGVKSLALPKKFHCSPRFCACEPISFVPLKSFDASERPQGKPLWIIRMELTDQPSSSC